MKKSIFTLLITAFTLSSTFAQTTAKEDENDFKGFEKGNFIATGGFSFLSTENGEEKVNKFVVTPKVGYFVSENIVLGTALGFSTEKGENEFGFTNERKTNVLSLGIFGRYYFAPSEKFSIFTELNLNYLTANSKIIDPPSSFFPGATFETKTNGLEAIFAPGFNYFFSKHFALEASFGLLSYSTLENDDSGDDETLKRFNIGLNLSNLNLGFAYRF